MPERFRPSRRRCCRRRDRRRRRRGRRYHRRRRRRRGCHGLTLSQWLLRLQLTGDSLFTMHKETYDDVSEKLAPPKPPELMDTWTGGVPAPRNELFLEFNIIEINIIELS